MIDITDLENKVNNTDQEASTADIPANEKLSATEFVEKVVKPIIELQEDAASNVKGIRQGGTVLTPDAKGIITFATDTSVVLYSEEETSQSIIEVGDTVLVNLRAVELDGASPTYGNVDVKVSTAPIGSSDWSDKGSFSLVASDANDTSYTPVDLREYLSEGVQQVRLIATGEKTQKSYTVRYASITVAKLAIELATDWQQQQTDGELSLSYYIRGGIEKLLCVEIDGYSIVKKNIGTTTAVETPYSDGLTITDSRVISNGVHTVRAWLECVADSSKKSAVVENQLYYNDGTDTEVRLVLNNLATTGQPYVDMKMFDYCIFSSEDTAAFIVKATNAGQTESYLDQDLGSVSVGEKHEYDNSFDVTSTETEVTVYLHFYTRNADGALVSLVDEDKTVVLDNSNNFAPTSMTKGGFILNPKVRSNSESEDARQVITNALDGQVVTSEFENFDWTNDGWLNGALVVPSGRKVKIYYDVFKNLADTASTASMTAEFDILVNNLQSYDAESNDVLTIGEAEDDGNILGLAMQPLRAHVLTQKQRNIRVQDIQWQEGERTHIAVNVVNNLSQSGENYVRIFINGVINREFTYSEDIFKRSSAVGCICIGGEGSDVYVNGVRIYQQALSSRNIEQDRRAAIAAAADKLADKEKNDILDGNGKVSFSSCRAKGYNTLRWIPNSVSDDDHIIPSYKNGGKSLPKGTWEMEVRDSDGNLIPKYTQRITNCQQKGQGTSSMTYWKWNITIQPTEDSQRYVWDGSAYVLDESVSGEDCYFLIQNGYSDRDDIKFVKGVMKKNWASSMQSHKPGWCNLYTDLYWKVNGDSQINKQSKYKNCRKSITQLPFLFFYNDGQDDVFDGPSTWGPAKFDKLCFGTKATSDYYDGKSIFTCLEGSSNVVPMPRRLVPWIREEVFYYLNRDDDDDANNECLVYNGAANLDVDKAVMDTYNKDQDDEYEIPHGFTAVDGNPNLWIETVDTEFDSDDLDSTDLTQIYATNGNTIKYYRRAFNFDFLHSHRISYYDGTYEQLQADADNLDQTYQYWVTRSDATASKYDLFRYNPLTDKWVNAGVTKNVLTVDGYAVLNIMEQCSAWFTKYNISYSESNINTLNQAFINARLQDYRTYSDKLYNESDWNFDQNFRKFGALKDNWCKNTYESLDPDGRISCCSDDNDTSGDLDNVGASTCPYYVEEHDHCDKDGTWNTEGEATYFNAQDNLRLCLREQAFTTELKNSMAAIMNAMEDPMQVMHDYFFDTVQSYYPAVVYNEMARLWYEDAKRAMKAGEYTNTVDPLSQSLGDHLQSELEFWKKRIVYIGSYCQYSGYANKQGSGTFSFRTSEASSYNFTVKAHQAIYPALMVDGAIPPGFTSQRLLPGETCTTDTVAATGRDVTVFLCGINYYTSIGDLTGKDIVGSSGTGPINVSAERLIEFIADGSDGKFAPAGINFYAPRLKNISVTNVTKLTGYIDVRECTNLVTLNLAGSTNTGINLPETASLTSVALGTNVTELTVTNVPNLTTLTIQNLEGLAVLSVSGTKNLNSQSLITDIYNAKQSSSATALRELTLHGISWGSTSTNTGIGAAIMQYLIDVPTKDLRGYINIPTSSTVNSVLKKAMLDAFGDVDSSDNSLYVTYSSRSISSIAIDGSVRIRKDGTYQYKVKFTPETANNFIGIKWSIEQNKYATIDENTGLLTATSIPLESVDPAQANITATVTLTDGTTNTATMKIYLYNRVPKVGDWAYSDGDFDEILHTAKTVIGWVYRVDKVDDNTYKCHVQAKEDLAIKSSNGGTTYSTFPWGIRSGDSYTPATLISQIAAALDLTDAQVQDITALANRTSRGLQNEDGTSTNYTYIKDYNAYDEGEDDGFMVYTSGTVAEDWNGAANTESIVAHAKKIIEWALVNLTIDSVSLYDYLGWGRYYPQSMAELADLLIALKNANTSADLRELAYPAAVGCNLYEPTANDLDSQYKAGKWYLPAGGDLVRQYIFFRNSRGATAAADTGTPVAANSDIDNDARPITDDAHRPWYANLLKRAADVSKSCPISLPTQSYHWSSTEYGSYYSWYVYFYSGYVDYNVKSSSVVVRPVVAFTFTL